MTAHSDDPAESETLVDRIRAWGPAVGWAVVRSSDTLIRWYVLHVLFFPFITVIFMAIHFWRVRKDGGISGPL